MTISLSDPLVWKIGASIVGIGLAGWRLWSFRRASEERKDIVVDGWVTRWSDNPAEYRAEEKSIVRQHRETILMIIVIGAFEIFVWMYI
jgi:hypothetical protein